MAVRYMYWQSLLLQKLNDVSSAMTVNSLIDENMQLRDGLQSKLFESRFVQVGNHIDKLAVRCKGPIKPELDTVYVTLNNLWLRHHYM